MGSHWAARRNGHGLSDPKDIGVASAAARTLETDSRTAELCTAVRMGNVLVQRVGLARKVPLRNIQSYRALDGNLHIC